MLEDDQLLVDMKENKSSTWKQIAEFFPGRSSGTLQAPYSTKLKAVTTQWTDETVSSSLPASRTLSNKFCTQKFRATLHGYEQDKWLMVTQKLGVGWTSAACKEKARELYSSVSPTDAPTSDFGDVEY
jgi:hypothetical protein